MRDNTYTNLFLSYGFHVRHQTSSKFKFKSWPEIFFLILHICFLLYFCKHSNIQKNWSLSEQVSLNSQLLTLLSKHTTYRESILCFGIDFRELESIFDGSRIDFFQIKTKIKIIVKISKLSNFEEVWWSI